MALKASCKTYAAALFIILLYSTATAGQTIHRRLTGLIEEPGGKHSRAISFNFTCKAVNPADNAALKSALVTAAIQVQPAAYTDFVGTCTTSYNIVDGNKGVSYPIDFGSAGNADMDFTIGPVKNRSGGKYMGGTVQIMTDGTTIQLHPAYQKPEETIWVGTYSKMVHEKEVATGKIVLHERKELPAPPAPVKPKPAPSKLKAPSVTSAAAPLPVRPAAAKPLLAAPPPAPGPDTLYAYHPLYRFNTSGLKVSVWDNYHVDGEIVRLRYGTAAEDIKLTADKQGFTYYIPTAKVATLTLTMINEGSDPGNTVSIIFSDGGKEYSFEVNGHAGQSFTYYFWHQ